MFFLLFLFIPHLLISSEEESPIHLNGIYLCDASQISIPDKMGIHVQGIDIPNETALIHELTPYLSESITMELLESIQTHILQFYKKQNFPFTHAYLPDGQDITEGIVHFVILEGKLGKAEAEGAK